MDYSKKIKELRESTGMNRREFCEYFDIPYRTVTEWERDTRHAPEYVLRLLEYYIRMENLKQCKGAKHGIPDESLKSQIVTLQESDDKRKDTDIDKLKQ